MKLFFSFDVHFSTKPYSIIDNQYVKKNMLESYGHPKFRYFMEC